jgi:hypothetical protein
MKMIVEKQMECRLAGETEVLGENLPQRHFCPHLQLVPRLRILELYLHSSLDLRCIVFN